jgi:hypothetical protein
MAKQWCKHYRGMHEKETCEAGVAFKDLPGRGTATYFDLCPCFGPNGHKCSKAEYPTVEEMAAHEAEMQLRFSNTVIARAAIVELIGEWKRGMPSVAGRVDCPVCKQSETLHFSRAGYNGHIHAKCKTDDCVGWME